MHFDKITFDNEYQWLIKGLLLVVISTIVLSLVLSILSVTARRNLDTPSTIGIFTTDDHHINWPGILDWRNNDTPIVDHEPMDPLKKYINIYTDAIWRNSKQRENKAVRLKWSQISLMVGIGLIGAVIGLTIFLGELVRIKAHTHQKYVHVDL